MSAKILITGDVVLDANIYSGRRMTPDSNDAGTRVIKTPGGAAIAHSLLRRLAGMKPDPRCKGDAFEVGGVLFSVQEPASWPDGIHASTLWEAVEVEAGKKKEKRWFPAKPRPGFERNHPQAMRGQRIGQRALPWSVVPVDGVFPRSFESTSAFCSASYPRIPPRW